MEGMQTKQAYVAGQGFATPGKRRFCMLVSGRLKACENGLICSRDLPANASEASTAHTEQSEVWA